MYSRSAICWAGCFSTNISITDLVSSFRFRGKTPPLDLSVRHPSAFQIFRFP